MRIRFADHLTRVMFPAVATWALTTSVILVAQQALEPPPTGKLVDIVLTRDEPITSGPQPQEREVERKEQQADLVTLSRRGKQVIAANSSHHIHLDRPDLVIAAIREMVEGPQK